MILSGLDIRDSVESGRISFSPGLEPSQWGEASVDLRLGFQFTKLVKQEGVTISVAEGLRALQSTNLWETLDIKENGKFGDQEFIEMKQGDFLLAKTYESIAVPRNMIARVEGRSTYARVGLSMHQTAPWIQPGWKGQIILELLNNGPLTIKLTPKRDRPCQITFFKLTQEVDEDLAYGAKRQDAYQNQAHPIAPKNHGEPLNRY